MMWLTIRCLRTLLLGFMAIATMGIASAAHRQQWEVVSGPEVTFSLCTGPVRIQSMIDTCPFLLGILLPDPMSAEEMEVLAKRGAHIVTNSRGEAHIELCYDRGCLNWIETTVGTVEINSKESVGESLAEEIAHFLQHMAVSCVEVTSAQRG